MFFDELIETEFAAVLDGVGVPGSRGRLDVKVERLRAELFFLSGMHATAIHHLNEPLLDALDRRRVAVEGEL